MNTTYNTCVVIYAAIAAFLAYNELFPDQPGPPLEYTWREAYPHIPTHTTDSTSLTTYIIPLLQHLIRAYIGTRACTNNLVNATMGFDVEALWATSHLWLSSLLYHVRSLTAGYPRGKMQLGHIATATILQHATTKVITPPSVITSMDLQSTPWSQLLSRLSTAYARVGSVTLLVLVVFCIFLVLAIIRSLLRVHVMAALQSHVEGQTFERQVLSNKEYISRDTQPSVLAFMVKVAEDEETSDNATSQSNNISPREITTGAVTAKDEMQSPASSVFEAIIGDFTLVPRSVSPITTESQDTCRQSLCAHVQQFTSVAPHLAADDGSAATHLENLPASSVPTDLGPYKFAFDPQFVFKLRPEAPPRPSAMTLFSTIASPSKDLKPSHPHTHAPQPDAQETELLSCPPQGLSGSLLSEIDLASPASQTFNTPPAAPVESDDPEKELLSCSPQGLSCALPSEIDLASPIAPQTFNFSLAATIERSASAPPSLPPTPRRDSSSLWADDDGLSSSALGLSGDPLIDDAHALAAANETARGDEMATTPVYQQETSAEMPADDDVNKDAVSSPNDPLPAPTQDSAANVPTVAPVVVSSKKTRRGGRKHKQPVDLSEAQHAVEAQRVQANPRSTEKFFSTGHIASSSSWADQVASAGLHIPLSSGPPFVHVPTSSSWRAAGPAAASFSTPSVSNSATNSRPRGPAGFVSPTSSAGASSNHWRQRW
ncbi:hypothetical protein BKA62DRAFT_759788 [Auriculariales sp. MPI-PUGE-AT-0066]|nr:hypothetical protein BKA62DRAFT_759788 [Auriculariales sp. MPI-PUGE-AT-0066]